jgi:serine/threonine-protein kinase RsbW
MRAEEDLSAAASTADEPPEAGTGHLPRRPVEVRVSSSAPQLSVLRTIAAHLAVRADFGADSIDDLRLAVDEACSSLIRLAAPGAVLRCRFDSAPDGVAVEAEISSDTAAAPRTDTLSWRVLTALTDNLATSVEQDETRDGHNTVRVSFTRPRLAPE